MPGFIAGPRPHPEWAKTTEKEALVDGWWSIGNGGHQLGMDSAGIVLPQPAPPREYGKLNNRLPFIMIPQWLASVGEFKLDQGLYAGVDLSQYTDMVPIVTESGVGYHAYYKKRILGTGVKGDLLRLELNVPEIEQIKQATTILYANPLDDDVADSAFAIISEMILYTRYLDFAGHMPDNFVPLQYMNGGLAIHME